MTQTDDMPIKAIAPWFGGKRNLAPLIVQELGEHRVYWEPFCGAMSVLLAKPPCVMETVNDLHAGLANLALVIQDPKLGPMFYRQIRRVLMHESVFNESREKARNDERSEFVKRLVETSGRADHRLMAAMDYFITSWLGRNGCAGARQGKTGSYCVRFTANGGHAATRWNNAVRSIPAWRRRLANVTILNRDGMDLFERIEDAPGTAIYCDPPYLVKGASYLHDFKVEDHARLAQAVTRFKTARVVVSYYDHPDLQALYPDWTRVTVEVTKAMSHSGQRGTSAVTATEVLLINGPSFTASGKPASAGLFQGE